MNLGQIGALICIAGGVIAIGCWLRTAAVCRRYRLERDAARRSCNDLGAVMLRHAPNDTDAAQRIHEALWVSQLPAEVFALTDRMRREDGWVS